MLACVVGSLGNLFFFSSRRRHTRYIGDWSSDVCSSDLAGLAKHGYRIVSCGTDNHLMLVDLRPKEINGKEAQEVLDRAGITVNKNGIPFDTYPIFKPGGIRRSEERRVGKEYRVLVAS